MPEQRNWAWHLAVPIVRSALVATTTHEWIGGENIPSTGGCIIVLNHVSYVDPLTAAHLVYDHGRLPHYLAKSGLFKNKALAYFLTAAGQIPVERLSRNAAGAFDAAVAAVNDGKCVVVYPEGTITRDPAGWPMTGKSGAARIALETGCPVIPVGQWGAQQLLAPYAKKPDLFPRKKITMLVGEPIDLSDIAAVQPRTTAVVQQATDRIMAAITALVEEVRGEQAPAERFDMKKAGVRQIGNPNKPGEDPS
jgi:1-acyl-sn-glycerol-3-phosphate acyltransferase